MALASLLERPPRSGAIRPGVIYVTAVHDRIHRLSPNYIRGFAHDESSRRATESAFFRRCGESDAGFGCEIEECESFLQVEMDLFIGVAQIADGCVLTDVKIEIAAASCDYESSFYRGRPNNFSVDESFDVFENGIAIVAGFGEFGVSVGAEKNGVRTVHADQTQLT